MDNLMALIPLFQNRRFIVATLALFLASAAWAQAPDQQSSPDRPTSRQPRPSSVEQPASMPGAAEKSRSDADRKVRETDRRLNRTLHSICNGCR